MKGRIAGLAAGVAGLGLAIADQAAAQSQWPVTVMQVSGHGNCVSGGKGRIVVEGSVMKFVGASGTEIWRLTLAADGSHDAVVAAVGTRSGSRVTVPSGNGPREITSEQQSQVCRYRFVPG